jgi:D-alanyl-D-alanine carboxypeptidase (penicillin-binding protein 5/6)
VIDIVAVKSGRPARHPNARYPNARHPNYLVRRIMVFGGAILILATGSYLPMTLLAPLVPVAAVAQQVTPPAPPAAELAWPGYGASSIGAIGFPSMSVSDGTTTPLPIASITKIITTLVVLDAKPLTVGNPGPLITFTAKDAALVKAYAAREGTTAPATAGMKLSQLEVNEVMLIASANNYAESYAAWAFGSEAGFLDAARTWLSSKGLKNTTLLDSSGMNPGNRSTASDLVAIGKLALANPVVAGIVSTTELSVSGVGAIKNSNKLLGHDGVDGIKTGTLQEAGACLLFSTRFRVGSHAITVVGVVLGGVDHDSLDAAVQKLIASAKAGFHEVTLAEAGQSFGAYTTAWNEKARAVAAKSQSVPVWADTPITATVKAAPITLAEAGAPVGSVKFTVGGTTISVPLRLDKSIDDPGALWRLGNPAGLLG